MNCHLVMAVRPTEQGKSRLAAALLPDERTSLNHNMLKHVASAALELFPAAAITVVSRSDDLLEQARAVGMQAIVEEGDGLNEALLQGARDAVQRGATSILTLSSDLPFLETDDLRAMLAAPEDVVIATDSARQGTNALLLRRPFAIPYRYGLGSLAAHSAEAAAAGLSVAVIDRPGLARDIDTPADLAELRTTGRFPG